MSTLKSVDAPWKIMAVLENAAEYADQSGSELVAAWQDDAPGVAWGIVAQELYRAAQRIAKRLDKIGMGAP